MSSVFWYLLNEDILVAGLKNGRSVGKETKGEDKSGSPGRVSSLAVLSHHIDATEQV